MDTRKATALIAYLAVTGQAHARDSLATLLWPNANTERARGALRRTLSTLRTGIGGDELRTDGRRMSLEDGSIDVDVRRFRALVSDGRLEEAVVAYTGDFLSGFSLRDSIEFDEWQAEQGETLRGELASALGRLALGTSDVALAIAHARRWVSIDQLHEPAHRALMRLHAKAGDRSAALRQYRECAHLLDSELGVTPLPETTALRDAIERGEEAPEGLSRPAAGTVHETVGDLYTLHGDYAKAIASYESAAAETASAARAAVEHKLANVHHRRGEWQEAERHYRAALRDAEGPALRARVSADWSLAVHRDGRHAQAVRLAREALSLAERARDDRALAQAHNILGILNGDRAHLERSLALAERIGDAGIRVAALNNLALACGRAGEHARAIALTETALAACREIGDRHREAALENNLADLLRAAGRRQHAMRHLKRAVTLFAEIGEPGAMEPEVWKLVEW
jgi:DNA-binding SARP family transcriptional activator